MRFFAYLRYSYSMEHQLNQSYLKCWLETEFDCRFRLRFSLLIQLILGKCGPACKQAAVGINVQNLLFTISLQSIFRQKFPMAIYDLASPQTN